MTETRVGAPPEPENKKRPREEGEDLAGEAKKRKEEQENWNKKKFSEFFYSLHKLDGFHRIDDVDENLKNLASNQGCLGSSLTFTGLLPEGVYRSHRLPNLDIVVKNGFASPLIKTESGYFLETIFPNAPLSGKNFKDYYREVRDLVVLTTGSDTIHIDWPDAKFITDEKLWAMMELVKERNLFVEFGPTVESYLQGRRYHHWYEAEQNELGLSNKEGQKRRDKFYNFKMEINENAAKNPENTEFANDKENDKYVSSLNGKDKLNGASEDLKKDTLRGQLYSKDATETQKLESIEKELDTINSRINSVVAARDHLQHQIDFYDRSVEADGADPKKLNELFGNNQESRKNLIAALENEYKDIKLRNEMCKEDLKIWEARVKEAPIASDRARLAEKRKALYGEEPKPVLTEDTKKELAPKVTQLLTKQEQLDHAIAVGNPKETKDKLQEVSQTLEKAVRAPRMQT